MSWDESFGHLWFVDSGTDTDVTFPCQAVYDSIYIGLSDNAGRQVSPVYKILTNTQCRFIHRNWRCQTENKVLFISFSKSKLSEAISLNEYTIQYFQKLDSISSHPKRMFFRLGKQTTKTKTKTKTIKRKRKLM